MQNLRYHSINIIAVAIFSFVCALTINQIVKNNLTVYPSGTKKSRLAAQTGIKKIDVDLGKILESGFFRVSSIADDASSGSDIAASDMTELKLIGTITGPQSIARALILKKGEKQAQIFRLWKDVYGYTLVGIGSSKIYLKRDKSTYTLDLFDKKELPASRTINPVNDISGNVKKNISRAEFQQKMLNNIDTAMQGIKAGPHRVNGQIDGFQLIRIRPYNVLYDYGLRSGDIIKRINGKMIDSTEKLYNMWQGFKNESRLLFDIERNGKIITLDVNITD